MSDDFRPSVASASAALGDATPLVQRTHPAGSSGAKLSLEEVARRVREGRLDPRIRAWAGEALIKAGRPKGARDQAQALLDAVRSQAMYAPDPLGAEMIVAAKNTLCLDEQGLCIRVADCDDLCVALGSALLSVGIPTKIVGQAFDHSGIPSHVLLAVDTKSGWKRVDPSSDKFKVGEYFPATKEWWIDPMDTKVSLAGEPGSGDFVGVGRIPIVGVLGEATVSDPESRFRAVAIVGAIIAGSTVAVYGIGLAMQAVKNRTSPGMTNPIDMHAYEVRYLDPIGRERMTVVSTYGDERDAVRQVRKRYTQAIRILYVHAD